MDMKKRIRYVLVLLVSLLMLTGCGNDGDSSKELVVDNNIGSAEASKQNRRESSKISVTSASKIAGLYVAYFKRAPDLEGLSFWKERATKLQSEKVLKELSAGFAKHPTFVSTYSNLNNRTFVETIYQNVLGKDGDKEGIGHWRQYLDNGNSRSDMVSDFVETSLTIELTTKNFPNLTEEELISAQKRQELLTNKVTVALNFTTTLGNHTNIINVKSPESDPAYLASSKILSDITVEVSSVSTMIDFIERLKEEDDPIDKINNPIATKGYLIDSPIQGVTYLCDDKEGLTDTSGMFECLNPPVIFKIGELTLGGLKKFTTDGKVYPQDLLGLNRANFSNTRLKLLARFLQSLDDDGIISEGINITEDIRNTFTVIQDFKDMNEGDIYSLLRRVGSKSLAKECGALKHLGDTSVTCNNDGSYAIDTPIPISNNQNNYSYIPKTVDNAIAIRFLNKATFGATKENIEALKSKGVVAWIDEQLALPLNDNQYLIKMIEMAKKMLPDENLNTVEEYLADNDMMFNQNVASFHSPRYRMSAWFNIALKSEDQLRQKVTYALSQIIVESDFEPIFTRRADALATYYDILHRNAFGNYEALLNEISLNSGMGVFLTFNGSKEKYTNEAGVTVYPDENYARELMQLFSIGLMKLNMDGTPILDGSGNPIPTYTQEDVNELARIFTGWDLKRNRKYGRVGFKRGDYTRPLEFTSSYHDSGEKSLLGETIPSGLSGEQDIQKAIEIIMSKSSVAPYISKNLIMRLTKSNPSISYVQRIAGVFQNSGGDLKAVTKAILLDEELWDDIKTKKVIKFKEPLVAYTSFLRAFNAEVFPSWYYCGYGSPSDDTASNCQVVNNSFLFNDTRKFLNQGAGLAPTVFNFYDNSFVPNSTKFKTNKLVAPEIQIQSDTVFINLSNEIRANLLNWEKNYMLNAHKYDYKNSTSRKRYDSVEAFIADAPIRGYTPVYYVGANKMILDASDELDAMEMVIDGDTNGDFTNLQHYKVSDYTDDEKAVDTLVEHLNQKLTGGLLTTQQTAIIADNLKDKIFNKYSVGNPDEGNIDESKYNKKRQLLSGVIFPAIRAVVTSSSYMTE